MRKYSARPAETCAELDPLKRMLRKPFAERSLPTAEDRRDVGPTSPDFGQVCRIRWVAGL